MTSTVAPRVRRAKAVYRRNDPVQAALRQALEALSDTELAELEADMSAFRKYGTASSALDRLIAMSSEVIGSSEDVVRNAA